MVYKFKLVSDEVSNFSREIEIDSENTFLQLRNVILDSVGYTKDHLDSFFICDEDWGTREEITLEDMGSDSDEDVWIMADTPLSELIEDEGQKVSYMFDYMTERSFFMELKEILPGRTLIEPICTIQRGKAPKQDIDLREVEKNEDKKTTSSSKDDLDIDFYGSDAFNEDEITDFNEDLSLN